MADQTPSAEMRPLIDRAIVIDRARTEREPLNRPAKLELTFDLSMLATYHAQAGQVQEAIHVFEDVLAIRESLVRADPRDEQAKDRLLYALVQLGRLHRRLAIAQPAM